MGNGVKISKEECLVRLWSMFSSVKLQIVSMACHSLRLCWVENWSQEWSKQLETDVRDINNLPKWKKKIKGQEERKIGFMVLETASTSWKWCINQWWKEVMGRVCGKVEVTLSSSQRDWDMEHQETAAAALRCEITGRKGLTLSWNQHHRRPSSTYRVKSECKRLCSPNWPLLASSANGSNH